MSRKPSTTQEGAPSPLSVRIGQALRRYFVTGLATLFPVAVTFWLLVLIFNVAGRLLGQALGFQNPLLGLMVTLLAILVVGVFSIHLFGRALFRTIEVTFSRLPFVRKIYPAAKQLAQFFFSDEKRPTAFLRVVLVEFPRPGIHSLGFVTNESQTSVTGTRKTLLTVLIPQPPSPFTGPIIFVPQEDVIPLELSVEDALKLIVSGGVIGSPLKGALGRTG